MNVYRGFLVEERSARLIGIQRGSVGQFSATSLCGGNVDYIKCLGHKSKPAVTAPVRAAKPGELDGARIVGTYDRHSVVAPGAIQGTAQHQAIGHAMARFVERATAQPELPAGPGKSERAVKADKRIDQAIKADEARRETDYQRMVRECKAGLDMSDPRHVARFERRLALKQEQANQATSLNAYLDETRKCGLAT